MKAIWYKQYMGALNSVLDLLLLAVIAVVVWRLWTVLGSRTGFGAAPGPISPEPALPPSIHPDDMPPIWQDHAPEGSELAKSLIEMAKLDPALDPSRFLDGAKTAHRTILEAFATGKLDGVKHLLSAGVFQTLDREIVARKQRSEILHYNLVGYDSARIVEARLDKTTAQFKTRFESRLLSWTDDAQGHTIIGNAKKIESHVDYWMFERDLANSDPNWVLAEIAETPSEE